MSSPEEHMITVDVLLSGNCILRQSFSYSMSDLTSTEIVRVTSPIVCSMQYASLKGHIF